MQILGSFTTMDPDETEVLCMDFVNDLAAGDSIASSSWEIEVLNGLDSDASSRLDGLAQVQNSTQSIQRLTGLISGVSYKLRAIATTQNGDTLTLWSFISCQSWTQ